MSTHEIEVRDYEPGDRTALLEIAAAGDSNVDFDAEQGRAFARILVATRGPEAHPIGFLLAWIVADEIHLIDLATHPEQRRRGVGKALLGALLQLGGSQRARLVLLEVRRSNQAALELYRSHGFRAIRIRRGYYDRGAEDAIEMSLELQQPNELPTNPMKDV